MRRKVWWLGLLGLGLAAACGKARLEPLTLRTVVTAGAGGEAGATDAAGPAGCSNCDNTGDAPIIVPGGTTTVPDDIADQFGEPSRGDATGGPCLSDPELGSLIPKNWLRPRFSWGALPAGTVVELRLSQAGEPLRVDVAGKQHALIVYTSADAWTMDTDIWSALPASLTSTTFDVALRSLDITRPGAVPAHGTSGSLTLGPGDAPGSIVYFSVTDAQATSIDRFAIGAETVTPLVQAEAGHCVGCHTVTPDEKSLAFSEIDNLTSSAVGNATMQRLVDGAPPVFLTPASRTLLARRDQQLLSFSPAHYKPGDHVALAIYASELTWLDLEATSTDEGVGWGKLAHTGDAGQAPLAAAWSHDGTFVMYTSGTQLNTEHILDAGDIYRIPYAARNGGAAEPVLGASDSAFNEFYPALSPDDRWLAFTRAPAKTGSSSYNNPEAELFVVPSTGGTPTRLVGNDPNSCLGSKSPGITNSFAAWAPGVSVAGPNSYYFLAFSSRRFDSQKAQLFVEPIVATGSTLVSYPALYPWNQPSTNGNLQPVWTAN